MKRKETNKICSKHAQVSDNEGPSPHYDFIVRNFFFSNSLRFITESMPMITSFESNVNECRNISFIYNTGTLSQQQVHFCVYVSINHRLKLSSERNQRNCN